MHAMRTNTKTATSPIHRWLKLHQPSSSPYSLGPHLLLTRNRLRRCAETSAMLPRARGARHFQGSSSGVAPMTTPGFAGQLVFVAHVRAASVALELPYHGYPLPILLPALQVCLCGSNGALWSEIHGRYFGTLLQFTFFVSCFQFVYPKSKPYITTVSGDIIPTMKDHKERKMKIKWKLLYRVYMSTLASLTEQSTLSSKI